MSNLLINEPPLLVLPSLAKKIGLNEAIFLQQVHYWLGASQHTIDGKKWIYNSAVAWQKQFPFWSTKTVKRIITSLEKSKILVSGCFNTMKMDRTKWYTIDYSKLQDNPLGQDESNTGSTCHIERDNLAQTGAQLDPSNTRDYTEITTKITTDIKDICASRQKTPDALANKNEKTKQLQKMGHLSGHSSPEIEIEKEMEREIDIEKDKEIDIIRVSNETPYVKIIELFNSTFSAYGIPTVKQLSATRKKLIKARHVNQIKDLSGWEQYFNIVCNSDFLLGRIAGKNGTFAITFDWLIKESNCIKVLEGNYNNKGRVLNNEYANNKPKSAAARIFEDLRETTRELEEVRRLIREREAAGEYAET